MGWVTIFKYTGFMANTIKKILIDLRKREGRKGGRERGRVGERDRKSGGEGAVSLIYAFNGCFLDVT